MTGVLIVVAHPDDEVLGCGATCAALAAAGSSVRACILAANADARANRPPIGDLRDDTLRAQAVLGYGQPILGEFPNIAFNTVPHLELVQFIEQAIMETGATTIFTHHPRDLNNDHLYVARAAQAAARLSHRGQNVPLLEDFFLMETLSSTDWSLADGHEPFEPNTFVAVDERWIERKIEALSCYRGVIRPRPHPRNAEIVRAQASLRGAQCGARWAEAFHCAFRCMAPESR